jgi:hypothetical protein
MRGQQPAGAGADPSRILASAGSSSTERAVLSTARCRVDRTVWRTGGSIINTKGGQAEVHTGRA